MGWCSSAVESLPWLHLFEKSNNFSAWGMRRWRRSLVHGVAKSQTRLLQGPLARQRLPESLSRLSSNHSPHLAGWLAHPRQHWVISTLISQLWWVLGQPTEKAMAPHSSSLAWKIPWTEEPGRLQSMGSLRVVHDWATSLSLFTFMHRRRKWQPTPVFLPGESQGWGSLVGCRLWGCTELDTTEAT